MKIHELEQKPSLLQKAKEHATTATLAVSASAMSLPAFAGFDTTEVVAEISSNKTSMNSVGLAVLGLVAIVVGFFMVRRMMR